MTTSYLDQIVYLNGQFIKAKDAKISIFDRGLLFSDAIYEGFGVLDGKIIDIDVHLSRLERSLAQLDFPATMDLLEIQKILIKLVELNNLDEGFLYLHLTRGQADRDYNYTADLKPNVFAFVQPFEKADTSAPIKGVKMASHPDLRWKRRDIKTSNLLGQVIAKQAAKNAGAYEALMIDDEGFITEGGATSFFIIKDGTIFARPVTNEILHGVTRRAMLSVADELALNIHIRKFTLDETKSADEAYLTGASSYIEPVVQIDETIIGTGSPGSITLNLREKYFEFVKK